MLCAFEARLGEEGRGARFAELREPDSEHVWLLSAFAADRGIDVPASVAWRVETGRGGVLRRTGFVGTMRVDRPGGGPVWIHADALMASYGLEPIALAAYRYEGDLAWLLSELADLHRRQARERRIVVFGDDEGVDLPLTTWGDIVLSGRLAKDIEEAIEDFVRGRERLARFGLPWRRGFLLAGPPGNGKTMVCKAIARTAGLPFVYFRSQHDSDDHEIDRAFDEARSLAPAVLCFEDVDTIFESRVTLSHFLNKLDGFEDNTGLLVLATTNHPETLDPALVRRPSRFDRVFRLDNPDAPTRAAYLGRLLGAAVPVDAFERAVRETEGFSMALLQELKVAACLHAVRAGRDDLATMDVDHAIDLLREQTRSADRAFASSRSAGFSA